MTIQSSFDTTRKLGQLCGAFNIFIFAQKSGGWKPSFKPQLLSTNAISCYAIFATFLEKLGRGYNNNKSQSYAVTTWFKSVVFLKMLFAFLVFFSIQLTDCKNKRLILQSQACL